MAFAGYSNPTEHSRNTHGTLAELGELPINACKQYDLDAIHTGICIYSCQKGSSPAQFFGSNNRSWAFLERSLLVLGLVCAALDSIVLLWSYL